MDVSEVKARLLEAVRGGETIVEFGDAVKASVSPQGGVYKVEVTGYHPVGFPHWDEGTSVAFWEGPEVDEAAQRVVDALGGRPAAMMQEEPVVEEKAEKKGDYVSKPPPGWDDPWSWLKSDKGAEKIREEAWKTMGSSFSGCHAHMGPRLGDENANAFCGSLKAAVEGLGPRYGKKEQWETVEEELAEWATVEKIIVEEPGEIVIYSEDKSKVLGRFPYGKGKKYADKDTAMEAAERRLKQIEFFKHQEADLRDRIDSIESAFRRQTRPLAEETAVEVTPRPHVVKLFDAYLIAEVGEKYYQVSYAMDKDKGPQFAPQAGWVEVEQVWSPKGKEMVPLPEWQKEPMGRMFFAAAKAFVQRKESETTVWQEGDRRFYMGLVSLPSIRDKEGEVVTAEGADFSIGLAKRFNYRSGLYIKHVVPHSLVGRMIAERRIGPFWVEFGEFKSTPLADWAFRVLENDKEGKWRFSIGFVTPKKQALAGRYTRLLKFDSTITEVPAQPLTAVLALMKGKTMNQSVEKLMTFLNPETDDERAQVTKMLAELFDVEEKELTIVVKQSESVKKVKAAIESLEDEELKNALTAALDARMAPPPGEEEKKKKKKELEDFTAVIEPLMSQIKALNDRMEAVEASAGAGALKELRDAMLTRAREYPKPSEKAPVVADVETLLKQLEQMVNPGAGGKHPLSGFAGGPGKAEGG